MSLPPSTSPRRPWLPGIVLTIAPLVLAACAGAPPGVERAGGPVRESVGGSSAESARPHVGKRAAAIAAGQVGVPYRYGGRSRDAFDCSGLVSYAYARAGKTVPRTTDALWRDLRPVASEDLEVGDVLFFDIQGKVSHVGLYLGRGRFVHAPSSGREVMIADLDSEYYRQAFIRGGRP